MNYQPILGDTVVCLIPWRNHGVPGDPQDPGVRWKHDLWGRLLYQLPNAAAGLQLANTGAVARCGGMGHGWGVQIVQSYEIYPSKTIEHGDLVGGLEHVLFSHIFGIIIPTDFHIFQRGRYTTNQG